MQPTPQSFPDDFRPPRAFRRRAVERVEQIRLQPDADENTLASRGRATALLCYHGC